MTDHTNKRQAPDRRLPRPFRQGDLDGLCGVYSVVNAIRALCPEIDSAAAEWLFSHLVQALSGLGAEPEYAVTNGIERRHLARIIRCAINYMTDEYEIGLTVSRLPKSLRQSTDLQELWDWLGGKISPTSVVILGLGGRHDHWTVAVDITAQQIRLFDSGEIKVLKRRHCTVGRAATRCSISPVHLFLIRRR
ncbi:MAG: hypothetical protein ACI89J_002279 [Hyphomicrobiaceae bacterium]|jgi:hypothetical protein